MADAAPPSRFPRKEHVEILLDQLTAFADRARHHIRGTAHNATLGAAAEAGVREIVRQHLPRSLVVTSGFIRKSDGTLLVPNEQEDLSRQTDVIIYDATRSCPLHSFEGIEIVVAGDVLGVIEVKDSRADEGVLSGDTGALRHIANLARAVPDAFRAIVLIEGGEPENACKAIEDTKLGETNAPHALYCRARGKGRSYIGFHDFMSNTFRIHAYDKPGSPLLAFLRLLTGFMSARGLMTASLVHALNPDAPDGGILDLKLDGRGALPSFYEKIREYREEQKSKGKTLSLNQAFEGCVESLKAFHIRVNPRVGVDRSGRPTAGSMLEVRYGKEEDESRCGAFFVMPENDFLVHVENEKVEGEATKSPASDPWLIQGERLDAYVRRVCKGLASEVFLRKDD